MGHWSPETESSPVRSFSLILWGGEEIKYDPESRPNMGLLQIRPINASRAKKCPGYIVIKSSISLDVASN
jgi:hypothetical protein